MIIERVNITLTINSWEYIQLFCVILKSLKIVTPFMPGPHRLCQHDPRHVSRINGFPVTG
ncbi:Uncharacterised protein [Escherichia coli]|uniref:Uncharacterized protein n=1 Tax=Escherichia coli TaxID=562 RepID=A0A377C5P6_ECOLX|nr:Uncharacterised protein [Escherichia coli]